MKIEQLEYFGIPSYLVEIWKKHYSPSLLPVQEKAVCNFNLLQHNSVFESENLNGKNHDFKNLLVISPSSSGKTFLAEMAIMQQVCLNRKALFLVPLRALAEEKYQHFVKLYQEIGLKIILSSRDHRKDDKNIINGNFHVAIVVYEKFYYFLLQYPQFLSNVFLIIADEAQLIQDFQRGPSLENNFNYVKNNFPHIRIIALSAFLENFHRYAKWLSATVLFSKYRPVELQKGIVRKGIFRYVEHNTGTKGEDIFFSPQKAQECNLASYLKNTLLYLLNFNESSLVFFSTKKEVRLWTSWLADQFSLPPAKSVIDKLKTMENSTSREELIFFLQKGISYHCADLSWQERHFIEEGIRNSDIKIICATGTLSMGVNLPVNNVIMTGQKVVLKEDIYSNKFYHKKTLSLSEVENMGGRAGRFNQKNNFGRMIFLAPSFIELTSYQKLYFQVQEDTSPEISYICRETDEAQSSILTKNMKIEEDLMTFLLQQIAFTSQPIKDLLSLIHNKKQTQNDNLWQYSFSGKITKKELWEKLHQLVKQNLIHVYNKKFCKLTELGKLIVSKGISYKTYTHFLYWLNSKKNSGINELEIILLLAQCADGEEIYISGLNNTPNGKQKTFFNKQLECLRIRLLNLVFEQNEEHKLIFQKLLRFDKNSHLFQNQKSTRNNLLIMKITLLMYDWINNREIREIEEEYGLLKGSVKNIGERFSWLADTLSAMMTKINQGEYKINDLKKVRQISYRLNTGIRTPDIPLSKLQIPGLTRGYIQKLVQEGYNNARCLQELNIADLEKILPPLLARNIKDNFNFPEKGKFLSSNSKIQLQLSKRKTSDDINTPASTHDAFLQDNNVVKEIDIIIDNYRPDKILFCSSDIKVNKISFQLISLLADNQGKMISYDEIIDNLWPADEDATYHRLWYHLGKLRNGIKSIIKNQNISGSPEKYIQEKILKVFPGRGLLLDAKILVKIKN